MNIRLLKCFKHVKGKEQQTETNQDLHVELLGTKASLLNKHTSSRFLSKKTVIKC